MRNKFSPARLASGGSNSGTTRGGLLKRAQEIREISRIGYGTSESFPWWRSGINANIFPAIQTAVPIVHASGTGEKAFKNDTDGVIKIQKLVYLGIESPRSTNTLVRVATRISSESQAIIKKWLQVTALHNAPNSYIIGDQSQASFTLPTPYFLAARNMLTGRVSNAIADMVGDEVTIALHGYHPKDLDPIVMVETVTLSGVGVGNFVPFSFSENRDGPLRDMMIERIVIGMSDEYASNLGGYLFSDAIDIAFDPPEGPKWSTDNASNFTPLCDQLSVVTSGEAYIPTVIHRFESPVTLDPGQSLSVEVMPLDTFDPVLITYVIAVGTQEGKRERG